MNDNLYSQITNIDWSAYTTTVAVDMPVITSSGITGYTGNVLYTDPISYIPNMPTIQMDGGDWLSNGFVRPYWAHTSPLEYIQFEYKMLEKTPDPIIPDEEYLL